MVRRPDVGEYEANGEEYAELTSELINPQHNQLILVLKVLPERRDAAAKTRLQARDQRSRKFTTPSWRLLKNLWAFAPLKVGRVWNDVDTKTTKDSHGEGGLA